MRKLKRDNGDTFNSILPNFFCIIVVLVLVVLFTSWIANVEHRENINQICRKYILQMEATGYLTAEMEADLVTELQNAGMNTITVESNTTKTQVQYGEDVYLQVSGTMNAFDYNVQGPGTSNMMKIIKGTDQWTVHVYKTSISKAQKAVEVIDDSVYIFVNSGASGTVMYNSSRAPKKINLVKGNTVALQVTANDGYYIENGNFIYGDVATSRAVDIPKIEISQSAGSISYNASTNTYTLPKAYESGTTIAITATGDGLTSITTLGNKVVGFTFQVQNIQTNKLFNVSYTARDDIKYTVNHYTRNLDGVTLQLVQTNTYEGEMGSAIRPRTNTYEGFTSPEEQTIVLALGNNTVDYIYERNRYNFDIRIPEDDIIRSNISTEGSSASGSYFYGDTIKLKLTVDDSVSSVFEINGFTSDWNNKTFNSTDSFVMPAQDVTVTPNIKANNYTIKYDANGGTGSISSKTLGYFDVTKLAGKDDGIKRTYYELLGWSTSKDATDPEYMLGEEVSQLTTSKEITLYAVWQDLGKTSYKASYYVQEPTGEFTLKETKTFTDNVFSTTLINIEDLKDSKYEQEGVIQYGYSQINGYDVTTFYPEADGSTHVHIYYTVKQYTLTVIPSNHSQVNATDGYTMELNVGDAVNLSATFETGYKFKDWKISSAKDITATKNGNDLSFAMPACDVTVELEHGLITYFININKNGGKWDNGAYQDYIEYNIETATFTIPNPVRDHYTFIGWTTDTIAEPQMVMQITKGTTGEINLYANWIAEMLSVTINCSTTDQGSVYINDGLIEFTNNTATLEVPYGTLINVAFVPNSKVSVTALNRTINGNTTDLLSGKYIMGQKIDSFTMEYSTVYNVKFEPLTYTITYHSNTKDNAKVVQTLTFNKEDKIYTIDQVNEKSNNKFVNSGWVFGGWSSKSMTGANAADFKIYDGGETVINLANNNDENIDLYATWADITPPTYTVNITNDVAEKQTITVNAVDKESGIKGYYYSDKILSDEELKDVAFDANKSTYDVINSEYLYIYVSDNAGNVYCNNEKYEFYKTTLALDYDASYNPSINYIITYKGNSFKFPTATKSYREYKGWSKNKDAVSGITTLRPTENATYYPVLVKIEAKLLPGIYVNTALKQLVNSSATYETSDTTITAIEFTDVAPTGKNVLISIRDDDFAEIYAYLDGTTIKIYTSAEKIYYDVNCSYMFANFRNITKNELLNFDKTLITTDMEFCEGMFENYGYNNLISLDLSKLNTSKVKDMKRMFYNTGYNKMTSIIFGNNFNTSNVTDMTAMFAGCGYKSLPSLNLGSNFNTTNVLYMNSMFADCGYTNLTSITFGNNFNSKNLLNTSFMFSHFGYGRLQEFTLPSNFNCEKVYEGTSMFEYMGHTSMTYMDISSYAGNFSTNLLDSFEIWKYEFFISNCGKPYSCDIYVPTQALKNNLTLWSEDATKYYQNVDFDRIQVKP